MVLKMETKIGNADFGNDDWKWVMQMKLLDHDDER